MLRMALSVSLAAAVLVFGGLTGGDGVLVAPARAQIGARAPSLAWQTHFSIDPAQLGVGDVLVAMRELPDPNFRDTVVLLTHYDSQGTIGVILNRQSTLPLSRVFPEAKDPKRQHETIFQGGPVTPTGITALAATHAKVEGATKILDGIYLLNDAKLLDKWLAAPGGNNDLRIYMGYAGWAPGQLEHEVKLGSWFIFPGSMSLIFAPHPESLWLRLIRRTELRYAFDFSRPRGL